MGKTTLEWSQEVDRHLEPMVALRRDFHRHPELSLQEHRTAQIIAERLHTAGFEVRTNIGGTTAVMGILHGD
jgi:hippurate hydrolase